ncbi:electron transfer flavoprotein subunit alpha/FixB family protein [Cupriavidus sp. CP313]
MTSHTETSRQPRCFTVLIAGDGDIDTQKRQATSLLRQMQSATATAPDALQVAILVAPPNHDDAMVRHVGQLGFTQVILLEVSGTRHPVQARDVELVLMRLFATEESLAPIGTSDLLCFAAGGAGEEVAARLAAALGAVALGRVEAVALTAGALQAQKQIYGGRCRATVRAEAGPWCCALRPGPDGHSAFAPVLQGPDLLRLQIDSPAGDDIVVTPGSHHRRPVETAPLVISGGRGMRADGFALLHTLADVLGGAVGASLPAVDAGWLPVTHQVGQSGKFVSPRQYVAVGISGTPQHLAGIGPDTSIIAINNDPDAEIFRHADLGVVGDWETILPALLAALADMPESRDPHLAGV